jgi:hypothetical protein
MSDWQPPRCEHGNILLGCPDDDCVEQSAYLIAQTGKIEAFQERQMAEARHVVREALGLPT